jgi:hypothetical protein
MDGNAVDHHVYGKVGRALLTVRTKFVALSIPMREALLLKDILQARRNLSLCEGATDLTQRNDRLEKKMWFLPSISVQPQ